MLNIAICDDMPVFRNDIERLIHQFEEEKGVKFGLSFFESGEELIKKFDEDLNLIDVFFLDYFMQELNGVQTALHIRKKNSNCNIVFVTSAVSGNLYEFMQVSPVGILSKPVKKEKIFEVMGKVVNKEVGVYNRGDLPWPII